MHRLLFCFVFLSLLFGLCACSDSDSSPDIGRRLLSDGKLDVAVVVPPDASDAVKMAAEDLLSVLAVRSGLDKVPAIETAKSSTLNTNSFDASILILAGVLPEGYSPIFKGSGYLDEQSYSISEEFIEGKIVLRLEGGSDLGLAYGLYDVGNELGATYYHPREMRLEKEILSEFPETYKTPKSEGPDYRIRGFHQHTQHPIVWSDFLLKAREDYKPYISEYFRYLLRNRQNAFQWHLLKGVDFESWQEYAAWIVEEGHRHGVEVGLVISFADKQQNNFRLIKDESADHGLQIAEGLEYFAEVGFDYFCFQFGTTEMTKLSDADTLSWFKAASEFVQGLGQSAPRLYAWIHTPSDLKQEDGSTPFFHLPLNAEENVGLQIHTTMFYDLEHPAPVYNNDNFHHQQACFEGNEDDRELIYFPETAWWLGFDNSLPIFLPITNYSRAYDVQSVIPDLLGANPLDGHITFTTGIEWNYWMFDHYLTKLTWNNDYEHEAYAEDISKIFGEHADYVDNAITAMTDRQVEDFYENDPLGFFYLAGESKYDELGAMTGLAGRPVKTAFKDIYEWGKSEEVEKQSLYAEWKNKDFAQLQSMADFYGEIAEGCSLDTEDPLMFEFCSSIQTTAKRAEHSLSLYSAVVDAIEGKEKDAYEKYERCVEISEWVKAAVAEMETKVYRYPLELLAREKPESLTAYPFGYLYETSTAHFWQRRDVQLKQVLDMAFDNIIEEFEIEVDRVFISDPESTEVLEPDSATVRNIIGPYIPPFIIGLGEVTDGKVDLVFAQDYNANGLPDDPSSSVLVEGATYTDSFEAEFGSMILVIKGDSGSEVGQLTLLGGTMTGVVESDKLGAMNIKTRTLFADIITMLIATGMFDEDSAWEMVANVFDIDPDIQPRPTDFAFELNTTFGLYGKR